MVSVATCTLVLLPGENDDGTKAVSLPGKVIPKGARLYAVKLLAVMVMGRYEALTGTVTVKTEDEAEITLAFPVPK